MSRRATGQARYRGGRWTARVTLGPGNRPTYTLSAFTGEGDIEHAKERAGVLAEFAGALRAAGALDLAPTILRRAASCPESEVATVRGLVDAVSSGKMGASSARRGMTFAQLASKWTSGELAREFPDHVRQKIDTTNDKSRLDNYILPLVKDVPVAGFTLDHADAVMRALPRVLSRSTRRQVAVIISRVMGLAVVPLRLISATPIPRGWLPRPSDAKPKAWLYPHEEAALMACEDVPLARRVAYGFLAREGCRKSEPSNARVDLEMGVITLDRNKTKQPRAWKLGDDVVVALARYGEQRKPLELAAALRGDQLRDDLRRAGVERAELFERTKERDPIDVHNLRDTFVTLALAAGRTESWIRARTGHKSSAMIAKYESTKGLAEELDLGWLAPLHTAIPELSKSRRMGAGANGEGVGEVEKLNDLASAPGRTRTFNPRIRSPMRYPVAPRVRVGND